MARSGPIGGARRSRALARRLIRGFDRIIEPCLRFPEGVIDGAFFGGVPDFPAQTGDRLADLARFRLLSRRRTAQF
ncbi:MAG TPA: hypothetical protein EYN79_02805 [Planctomycetes bacterium]|nr:hypothetical protein [Planctomycetota bacterium]HIN80973.1 hypothetical protein [Planctomycetota bacterium]